MNHYYSKLIDQKLNHLSQFKKMVAAKVLTLTSQNSIKLDNHQKFLKLLKKQYKEQKTIESDFFSLVQSFLEDHDQLLRLCYWNFRIQRTDFQALFVKLKFTQQLDKKQKAKTLQDIINFQRKKQGEILINSKNNLLLQLRNQVQDFDLNTLILKSLQIFQSFPFFANLSEDKVKCLSKIVHQICKNYNIMPFHNFTHGFQVFISFNSLCQTKQIANLLDDFSILFWHIACLSHDIQHQGVNTLFQVKTNSYLSGQFGKFAVIQKMHLSKIIQIIVKRQGTNKIFQDLSKQQKIRARKIIAKAIMATDMSKHYEYVTFISQKQINYKSQQDKQIILQALVHACDIQNPSLDFQSYMYWAHLVCKQFHDQTLRQKQLNVQITDFLKFDSLTYFYKNQMNFANSIVLPLWHAFQTLFPQIKVREYTSRIKKNISILNEALRRNSQPVMIHKQLQQYINNHLIENNYNVV